MKQQIKIKDLFWLFAFPFYLVICIFRHEASHAISAILEGARIKKFVFWPTTVHGHFIWGYVMYSGHTSWITTAAPYICDLATYLVFFIICPRIRFKHHWVWFNLVIIGLVSSTVNSAKNYIGAVTGISRSPNDVVYLLHRLPAELHALVVSNKLPTYIPRIVPFVVHFYFVATLLLYVVGLFLLLKPKAKSTAYSRG